MLSGVEWGPDHCNPSRRRAGSVSCALASHYPVATEQQWSGYAAAGRTFTEVSASLTVPTVVCPEPNMNASFWVGLDGFDNTHVEQIAVEAPCRDGVARYPAWWQAYPAAIGTAGVQDLACRSD
jgi:Peptidase A4 family